MKNSIKHLAAATLLLSAFSPVASFALDVPGNIAVADVGCVEMDAYTQNYVFDRTPVVVRAGATNNFQVAPSLTVGTSPLVREWEVKIVKPAQFSNNVLSITNTLTRLGLLSAAPGTVSAQILGADGTWRNTLSDSGGRLVLPSIRPMSAGAALVVGSIDYATGEMLLDVPRWGKYLNATNALSSASSIVARVRVAWTPQGYSGGRAFAPLPLEDPAGPIVCSIFADMDGSGAWTPGEPYGASWEFTYLWGQSSFLVGVGLSDTCPSFMRCDLAGMIANNSFDAQATLNDRGVNGYRYYANKSVDDDNLDYLEAGTDMPSVKSQVRVRIVRHSINGAWRGNYNSSTHTYQYAAGVVFDDYLNLEVNPTFAEDRLLQNTVASATQLDLDWDGLATPASSVGVSSFATVYSVKYVVVIGEGSVTATTTNNNIATCFVNAFEDAATQTKAEPIDISTGTNFQRSVAFSWRHDSPKKAFPAFRLRVYKTSGDTLIYDTGVRRAPPRDTSGVYHWSPPDLWVGEQTPKNLVFLDGTNYYWTVSMLDAKHTTPNSSETKSYFRVQVR